MKKVNLKDVTVWEAFKKVRDSYWDVNSPETKYINLSQATVAINGILTSGDELSEDQLKTLLTKGIFRFNRITTGKDSKNRDIASYEIVKQDLECFENLMKAFEWFVDVGLAKKSKHPEKNSNIIEYYMPTTQHRLKVSEFETKATVAMQLLSNPFIAELMKELATKA